MALHYLETGSQDPCFNLAFEEYILENRSRGDWLLLWQNANTVVVGLNQNTAEEIDPDFVAKHHITVVRRMTGGGAVYHDLGNLNYSFITDLGELSQMSVARFCEPVCRALAGMGVSASVTGRNDITVEGRKVSGVAQRIHRGRILHHGTLLFDSNPEMIAGALRADPSKFNSKSAKSVQSRVGLIRNFLPQDMALSEFWQRLLDELGADGLIRESLEARELAQIRALADEKYRSWDWNYGRSPNYSFTNRRRFEGGSITVQLAVEQGIIRAASFRGDFMAQCANAPAAEALLGRRFERESVKEALAALELRPMFGGITADEILAVMFGQEGER